MSLFLTVETNVAFIKLSNEGSHNMYKSSDEKIVSFMYKTVAFSEHVKGH